MLSPGRTLVTAFGLVTTLVVSSHATVPGGIDITCDVPRIGAPNFRSAASGQTDVKFKLWSAASGGSQLGADYTVVMGSLVVAKRYTEKYDSVSKRRAMRINAVIGNDGSPVLLPSNGEAWLEVVVGTTTLGCDFSATGSISARKRLQSVAFSRESNHSETCDACTGTVDVSARVFNSGSINIADSTNTILTFDSERWDTDSIHSTSVDTSRLTATTAGKYYIFAHTTWQANPTGRRTLKIKLNSGDVIAFAGHPAIADVGAMTPQSVGTHYQLGVGDYVEVEVSQASGGSLSVDPVEKYSLEFGLVKLP